MDAPKIPAELFFAAGERSAPKLSPDGTRLAYAGLVDGVANLFVEPVDGGPARQLTTATRDIRQFDWDLTGRRVLFPQDTDGDERYRLHALDVETGELWVVVDTEGVSELLLQSPRHPTRALVLVDADVSGRPDVHLVDLDDRSSEVVATNTEGFTRWVPDLDLALRAAVRPTPGAACEIVVRDTVDEPWRVVRSVAPEDAMLLIYPSAHLGFSADGRSLYLVTSVDADVQRLARLDVATGELETVAEVDGYDLLFVSTDPATLEPRFARVETDRFAHVAVDPAIADDVAFLEEQHPDSSIELLSEDAADTRWVYRVSGVTNPGALWIYDREGRTTTKLFDQHPELVSHRLARREPFRFTARDGLELLGYLTFPVDVPEAPLPTIVRPHGGPWHRDPPGWHPWSQWLASRGYLVVEVEFRGSLGFGKRHLDAGDLEWGREMHHDVLDAITHVVSLGHADPERLAMLGGSYGGYETMWTVSTEHDLLRCAVAGMPAVDLTRDLGRLFGAFREVFGRRIGDRETQQDMLWERSPLRVAGGIRTPLLLFYGGRDARVDTTQVAALREVLDTSGVDYEVVFIERGGHFVESMDPADRRILFDAIDDFLAEHLQATATVPA